MLEGLTKGVKTSEFWAVILPFIAGTTGIGTDKFVIAAQIVGVVYAALRTALKVLHIRTNASLNSTLVQVGAIQAAAQAGAEEAAKKAQPSIQLAPPAAIS